MGYAVIRFIAIKDCFSLVFTLSWFVELNMEPILEIETDLLPPEKIPTATFEFPKAWINQQFLRVITFLNSQENVWLNWKI